LLGSIPPVIHNTNVVEVAFQVGHLGWKTDDLLLTGETSDGSRRKLVIQVKRSFSITASDEECSQTFCNFWDDFNASERFNEETDGLAIVTLLGTKVLLGNFGSLLDCAHSSDDVCDFKRRLGLKGYIDKKSSQQYETIKSIISGHIGEPPDEELFFRFIKVVHLLSLDLNTHTSQNQILAMNQLASLTDEHDPIAAAEQTWSSLLELAASGRPQASTYSRKSLPQGLRERHTTIPTRNTVDLQLLIEHGVAVCNSINSTIGDIELDRENEVFNLTERLSDHRVVILSGAAGSGKSALAKRAVLDIGIKTPVLAFQAVEFAKAHLDEVLVASQTTLNSERFAVLLSGLDRSVIFIDGIERLLEHSIRDAFNQLLQVVGENSSVQLIVTCRSYSAELLKNALITPAGLAPAMVNVSPLSDDELDQIEVSIPKLTVPLQQPRLRNVLRNPFILSLAYRLSWDGENHEHDERSFREKCWIELIRDELNGSNGMPDRREKMLLDVARRRASNLTPFVAPSIEDDEVLDILVQSSLLNRSPKTSVLYAPAHDILEDWAILRWIEREFHTADDPAKRLSECTGGYPALRRGFRQWLEDHFDQNSDFIYSFVCNAVTNPELPNHFRDDCLVSTLLSESASNFVLDCQGRIESGDMPLLFQIINILRVACKQSPTWVFLPGLPSEMLVPKGTGWNPTLKIVAELLDKLLPDNAYTVLGFLEDWAKQVDQSNPVPAETDSAGRVIEQLLTVFEGYPNESARNRTLSVMLKIPLATQVFNQLMDDATKLEYEIDASADLAKLVMGGFSVGNASRDFPAEVIKLANFKLKMDETDIRKFDGYSSYEVAPFFGIRERSSTDYFPASAYQGPFLSLLHNHPEDAVQYIIDLLNHSAQWYGEEKWPGEPLEPLKKIAIDVPNHGPIEQWANSRLYLMHRGLSVGPYALQSALMALENWLLKIAKIEGAKIEDWLLRILIDSNNVMATGVIASICIAYPSETSRVGVALLSCRELIQYDRIRLAKESGVDLLLGGSLIAGHRIYQDERRDSNALAHRKTDVEWMALQLQFSDDTVRDQVADVLDLHRARCTASEAESEVLWKLVLNRMDIRKLGIVDSASTDDEDSGTTQSVSIGPVEMEPEVQQLVDAHQEEMSQTNRFAYLFNEAIRIWEAGGSHDWDSTQGLLSEARSISEDTTDVDEHFHGGPGILAAACLRDFRDKLSDDEFAWCAKQVEIEIRKGINCSGEMSHLARSGVMSPDRPCAGVACIVATDDRFSSMEILALALTHPVLEVSEWAHSGVGLFLENRDRAVTMKTLASTIRQGSSVAAVRNEQESLPFWDRTPWIDVWESKLLETREYICGDADIALDLAVVDPSNESYTNTVKNIFRILRHHPDWDEATDFFCETAKWLEFNWSNQWKSEVRDNRKFDLEQHVGQGLAKVVISAPLEKAVQIVEPLLGCSENCSREVARFITNLITEADSGADDNFWSLWQLFADRVTNSKSLDELDNDYEFDAELVDQLFLGIPWQDGVSHWRRLDDNHGRIEKLALQLPPTTPCLRAYLRYLSSVGRKSLPMAFKTIAAIVKEGATNNLLKNSTIMYYLESLLTRFVYSEPQLLKSDESLRDSVLFLLDSMIEVGSASAYRLRDDFVTPLSPATN